MKFLAVFLAAAVSSFGANAQLLNLVMPDAKVVAGFNVTTAKVSPLGQFLIKQLPNGFPSIPGFDPLNDVTEMVAASTGGSGTPTGLIMMAGTFDPSKILQPGWTTSQYDGATLVTFPQGAAAFIGTTIAVVGDPASVKAAIDRSGGANVTTLDPALSSQIASLSTGNDAWIASIASPAALFPSTPSTPTAAPMQFLAAVQSFSASVKFDETVPITLNLVADTPQNAEALGNVAKLLVSMVGSNGPPALQNLKVTVSGTNAQLVLLMPEAQLETLLTGLTGGGKGEDELKRAPLTWLENSYLKRFLRGRGIEIGALWRRFPVPARSRVWYLDHLDGSGLEAHYPELTGRILPPDVLAEATRLPFAPASLDFVIASHVLEHMPFPLAALRAWHQVLRPGGVLLLKIPDKRYTFDVKRERTTLQHLIEEDADPQADQRPHFADWVRHVGNPPVNFDQAVDDLMQANYSIHFHVWTSEDIEEIINHLQLNWKVALFWKSRFYRKETTVILTR